MTAVALGWSPVFSSPLPYKARQGPTLHVMEEERARVAAAAVADAMESAGWTPQLLADAAMVDVTAVRDFISGRRWPRVKTRNSIERALEWPVGRIAQIAAGQARSRPRDPQTTLDLSRLSEPDRYEVLALYHRLLKASGTDTEAM